MTDKSPILVTGSHRSGTTWVGRMLAAAPNAFYIHEPFSVSDAPGRGISNLRLQNWFTYITRENEADYYKPVKNTVELKYDWKGAFKDINSFTDFKTAFHEYRHVSRSRHNGARVILKDPIAFFSSAWLAERFKAKVVILVRHPAAFISSLIKLNWEHPFQHFLSQHLMMKNLLGPFRSEIEEYSRNHKPLFDQAILLWKIIHHQVLQYQKENPDWIYIRHEDLSRDPFQSFQNLYEQLDLEFTQNVRDVIQEFSGINNPGDSIAPVGSEETLKRHSKSNILNWKNRLSQAQIEEIRGRVEEISRFFYTNNDW